MRLGSGASCPRCCAGTRAVARQLGGAPFDQGAFAFELQRPPQRAQRAAHPETRALDRRLAVFLTLLEPVMILLMGRAVLMIVLAILP